MDGVILPTLATVSSDLRVSRLQKSPERRQKAIAFAVPPIFGRRGMQFLLLMVAVAFAAYARVTVSPLQEALKVSLGLSDNEIALLQGPALALPFVMAAVPLGLLIDRCSRVHLVLTFAVFDMGCSLLTAVAPNFVLLFATRCLLGLSAFAVNPVALSLIADLYAPSQRGRATMVLAIGQFAGISAAFGLGGSLLAISGFDGNGWRWTMLGLTCPLAPVVLLTLMMRDPQRTELMIRRPSVRDAWVELWRYRAMIAPLLIGLLMIEIAIGAVMVWTTPTLARSFRLSPDHIGAIMSMCVMVSGTLGPIAGGPLADLCQRAGGPRQTASLLSVLSLLSVPSAVFAVVPTATLVSVLLVTYMTIINAMLVMGTTLYIVVVPGELRGLCLAMLAGACVLFGIGLAPLTVSLLSGAMGGSAMIGKALASICVLTTLLCAATFGFGRRYFARVVAH